jgi:protein involved in temperature-dependent protein secretion
MAPNYSVGFLLENDSLFIEEKHFMNFDHESNAATATRNNEQLLGPAEVAKWLGVSAGWVRDHATRKDPRIKTIKIGKLLRFRPKDVEDFLRESTENAA